YGLAKVSMHNREHIVILRPDQRSLVLHTMYYADEVRRENEYETGAEPVRPKELELAKMLIESLAGDFEPRRYRDTYRDNLMQMIEAKVEGRHVVATPAPHIAPVVDIMEALRKSLAERKPAATATASTPAATPKKRQRRSKAS
ncbi:MAG: Ku protein, partial [Acidobacteria bacterium]|nr:Ku protein [Acidobacteriota bacterium]